MNSQEKKDVVHAFISHHYGMYIKCTDHRLTLTQGRLVAARILLSLGPQLQLTMANTYLADTGPLMSHSRNPRGLPTWRPQIYWNGGETGK